MMGIVEEIQQWGKDPRMDHGYRARTPGYREYADNVINEMKESYLANSGIPIVADAAGAKMDYEMFRDHPESRTLPNFLLAGAAALPFVPRMAQWGKSKIPSKKQYSVPENWVDGYHGTRAEALTGTTPFKQMPNSDFGIHMGSTPEQANLRLKQTSADGIKQRSSCVL